MTREELDETMGYLSAVLDDALGSVQLLESDCQIDERFVKLREMIEAVSNYCNDLWDSLD